MMRVRGKRSRRFCCLKNAHYQPEAVLSWVSKVELWMNRRRHGLLFDQWFHRCHSIHVSLLVRKPFLLTGMRKWAVLKRWKDGGWDVLWWTKQEHHKSSVDWREQSSCDQGLSVSSKRHLCVSWSSSFCLCYPPTACSNTRGAGVRVLQSVFHNVFSDSQCGGLQ